MGESNRFNGELQAFRNEPAIATSERWLSLTDRPYIVPDKPNVATISFAEKREIAST